VKVIVNKHNILLEKEPINEKEINVSYCEFEFDEDITNDFVKEAYFTLEDKTYKQIINNNKCEYPSEILDKSGVVMIGVVAYKVVDENTEIRYNPSPAYFYTLIGSLKEADNTQPITPSEMEQYMQLLESGLEEVANVDIDIETTQAGADVSITNRNGTTKVAHIVNGQNGVDGQDGSNGVGLNYNWNGTSLGVKREDEQNYQYTNLKGDTGNPGQDGKDGVDGVSPTITSSKSGSTTTITITDKTGKTTATINDGINGTNGTNGQDGYTPQRGVDYWTTSDIQAIQSYCDSLVLGALGGSY
jgi:hypothetical protein